MHFAAGIVGLQRNVAFPQAARPFCTLRFGVVDHNLAVHFHDDVLAFHRDVHGEPLVVLGVGFVQFDHRPQAARSHWVAVRVVDLDLVPVEEPAAIVVLDVKVDAEVRAARRWEASPRPGCRLRRDVRRGIAGSILLFRDP